MTVDVWPGRNGKRASSLRPVRSPDKRWAYPILVRMQFSQSVVNKIKILYILIIIVHHTVVFFL